MGLEGLLRRKVRKNMKVFGEMVSFVDRPRKTHLNQIYSELWK